MTPQLPTITPPEFIARWRDAGFGERQGAQSFFNDLCGLVGHPTPAAFGDPAAFTFEKAVPGGFADAYYEEHFGWEFKGRDAQLDNAFEQLLRYQVHLKTPPLLVVSSFQTVRVQTNFPGMETARYDIGISKLVQPEQLQLLRDAFFAPQRFRERLRSVDAVTRQTVAIFQAIVEDMERHDVDPERLARYLNQLVFCLYSEDAGLLPEGLFTRIVGRHYRDPATFDRAVRSLFAQMATGGFSGADEIAHFNGDLFKGFDQGAGDTVELSTNALQRLGEACENNWRDIEPSIFGTLFERALDASKRAQTGAHYTGADDIALVVEPVVMTPLRREWDAARAEIEELLSSSSSEAPSTTHVGAGLAHGANAPYAAPSTTPRRGHVGAGLAHGANAPYAAPSTTPCRGHVGAGLRPAPTPAATPVSNPSNPAHPAADNAPARQRLEDFRKRLASVTVLDPACGSGNFLYIALRSLLDLEKEVIDFAAARGWAASGETPTVQPNQMLGLEINHYAAELARTALWIGYIQWHQANGFPYIQRPILTPLDTIRQTDAILHSWYESPEIEALLGPSYAGVSNEQLWPEAQAIFGPRRIFQETEWPAAEFIVGNPPFLGRGGLRGRLGDEYTEGLYKTFGNRLPNASDLCCYWLEKARAQIEAGATKRAGLLATQGIRGRDSRAVLQRIKNTGDIFFAYSDKEWMLDGATVHISIVGFDNGSEKEKMFDGQNIARHINANLTVGIDVTLAKRLVENKEIAFEGPSPKAPFDITSELAEKMLSEPINVNGRSNSDVIRQVLNARDITQRARNMYTIDFGLMGLNEASQYEMPFEHVKEHVYLKRLEKSQAPFRHRWWQYATPRPNMREALHGLDRYIATPRVSKHRIFVWVEADIMCNDSTDVFARDDDCTFGVLHSRWHEVWARSKGTQLREAESGFRYTPTTCFETFPFPRPTGAQRAAIAGAAAELNRLREGWLHPPDLSAAELRRRTLTNLYNQRPTWLDNAHRTLDAAVAAAYGWPADLADGEILERLLALNLARAGE